MDTPYEVGYRKPPTKTQFKKGKSGDPLGRRVKRMLKGGANEPLSFGTALIAELKSKITVSEAGRTKKITKLEAFIKTLVVDALQHDKGAIKVLLAHVQKLPENAFAEDGDGIYTWRYNQDTRDALEFIVNDFANYEIPEEDRDGAEEQEEQQDSPE